MGRLAHGLRSLPRRAAANLSCKPCPRECRASTPRVGHGAGGGGAPANQLGVRLCALPSLNRGAGGQPLREGRARRRSTGQQPLFPRRGLRQNLLGSSDGTKGTKTGEPLLTRALPSPSALAPKPRPGCFMDAKAEALTGRGDQAFRPDGWVLLALQGGPQSWWSVLRRRDGTECGPASAWVWKPSSPWHPGGWEEQPEPRSGSRGSPGSDTCRREQAPPL